MEKTTKEVLQHRNIERFSIVKLDGYEWVLENASRNPEIQRIENGKRIGKQIDKYTQLEVVRYPAQLAWEYLEAVNERQKLIDLLKRFYKEAVMELCETSPKRFETAKNLQP